MLEAAVWRSEVESAEIANAVGTIADTLVSAGTGDGSSGRRRAAVRASKACQTATGAERSIRRALAECWPRRTRCESGRAWGAVRSVRF